VRSPTYRVIKRRRIPLSQSLLYVEKLQGMTEEIEKNALLIGFSLTADPDLMEAIGSLGLEVRVSETGRLGLVEMSRRPPSLIIIDPEITDLYCAEICRDIRNNQQLASTPVLVFFSREPEAVEIFEALESGADDCFTLQDQTTQIIAKIEWLMMKRKSAATLRQYYADLKTRQVQTLEFVRATANLMESIDAEFRSKGCLEDPGCAGLFEDRLDMGLDIVRSLASILEQQMDAFELPSVFGGSVRAGAQRSDTAPAGSMELAF
jgi:CheY-like chemotaxis protein